VPSVKEVLKSIKNSKGGETEYEEEESEEEN